VGLPNQAELVNHGGMPYFDQPGVHDIYRSWRKILNSYPGERIGVAEAWTGSPARTARYVVPDELHQAFNFDYLQTPWSAGELREVITSSLAESAKVDAPTTWVLSNHDVQRHATRFGAQNPAPDQNPPDQNPPEQHGSTDAGPVGDGLTRARAAALLMFALPGSCYVYQGEELGLPEVLDLPAETRQDPQWFRSEGRELGRDGCRVPIPWSGQRQPFGFSPTETTEPWLPQPAEWAELTAERQRNDPGSMLSMYRDALRLRRSHPALGPNGLAELRWIPAPEGVLAFVRPAGSGSSTDPDLLCAVNLTGETVTLPALGELILASGQITESGQAGCWDLPADTTGWWSLRA
jgi:alpha-glucosidase